MDFSSYDSRYPMFVRNDDDRLRWKASIDVMTEIYGLKLPRNVDLLQMLARSVYNSDISTAQMFGPQPEDRPVSRWGAVFGLACRV